MRNKTNKQNKLMLKKLFAKDQLLIMNKFPSLLAYDIPYPIIKRAYNRYLKNIDNYLLVKGYPSYWFSKDKRIFGYTVKLYIESKKISHEYKFGSRGYTQIEIVKLSGLDKYLDQFYLNQ